MSSRLRTLLSELGDTHVRHMLFLPFTLPFTLRRFFDHRVTMEEARARLKSELENREERFLELARTRIYGNPEGPYAKLLAHAGCEVADLEGSLRNKGLEETLSNLAHEGVYLTASESKGKEDVVRGGLSFRVVAEDLGPPRGFRRGEAPPAFVTQSSGTNNRPMRSVSSLAWQVEDTPAVAVFLEAHGLLEHRHAAYEPMLTGVSAGIVFMMMAARIGVPVARWFARPVPMNNGLEGAYFRVTAHELALFGTWFGPGFARPELVPTGRLDRIVRWVEECEREGIPTCIRTVASNAARIGRVANEMGASLKGCTFIASGEPLTAGKRRVIEEAGAEVTVLWGYEPGPVYVGFGCGRPAHGDEMHIQTQSLAVIEHPDPIVQAGGEPVHPLLFTTLYPSAARFQLNVSNGDYAVLFGRRCGCALEEAGLKLHVRKVGSYEKLTSEGLAYSYENLLEFLETTLPDEFGGGPGDYQILEEEGVGGQTFLTLLVDPRAGEIDEESLLERLASELAGGDRKNRFMSRVWQDAGTLRVRREEPVTSDRGKILPLRVARKR